VVDLLYGGRALGCGRGKSEEGSWKEKEKQTRGRRKEKRETDRKLFFVAESRTAQGEKEEVHRTGKREGARREREASG